MQFLKKRLVLIFVPLTLLIIMLFALLLTSCGQEIDEAAVIEGNATNKVTSGGNVYEISGQTVTMNGAVLASDIGASSEMLVLLGNKLYFNTDEGTKYISLKNGKIKKFGNGQIVYAKGKWLYYNNIDLYRVSVTDGKQGLLHQRTQGQPMLRFKEETDGKIIFTDGEKDFSLGEGDDKLTEIEN